METYYDLSNGLAEILGYPHVDLEERNEWRGVPVAVELGTPKLGGITLTLEALEIRQRGYDFALTFSLESLSDAAIAQVLQMVQSAADEYQRQEEARIDREYLEYWETEEQAYNEFRAQGY